MRELIWSYDDDDARAFFEYAGYKARNPSEPLRTSGRRLLSHINETFAAQGAYDGQEPWAQLRPYYAKRKLATWGPRPILVASGRLRGVAKAPARIRIERDIGGGSGGELLYELEAPFYGELLQDGFTAVAPNGKTVEVPARPFVNITPHFVEGVEFTFRTWLEEIRARNRARRSVTMEVPL